MRKFSEICIQAKYRGERNVKQSNFKGEISKDTGIEKKEKDGKIILWAYYRLAVNRKGLEANFINCVVFGREAEFIKKYAKKEL